ncbi:hypothetical protein ACHHYP_06021 [Achlya hypogyna]|uniref:Uncharacterized protein n=1 Tax=Achlya hypogyna TaxID=1202772 RepID=A0A1V9ZNA8_ACHHY|nr:hypothetical protein ACHHYP_06021 [Achlya hypogyna]
MVERRDLHCVPAFPLRVAPQPHRQSDAALGRLFPPVEFHHFGYVELETVKPNVLEPEGNDQHLVMLNGCSQFITNDTIKALWLKSSNIRVMKTFWVAWLRYEDSSASVLNSLAVKPPYTSVIRYCAYKKDIFGYFKTDCEGSSVYVAYYNARVKRNLKIDETVRNGAGCATVLIEKYERIYEETGVGNYYDAEPKATRTHVSNAVRPEHLQTYLRQESRYQRWDDFVGLLIDTFDAYVKFDQTKQTDCADKDVVAESGMKKHTQKKHERDQGEAQARMFEV